MVFLKEYRKGVSDEDNHSPNQQILFWNKIQITDKSTKTKGFASFWCLTKTLPSNFSVTFDERVQQVVVLIQHDNLK